MVRSGQNGIVDNGARLTDSAAPRCTAIFEDRACSPARQFHFVAWHARANPGILDAKLGSDASFDCTAILTPRWPVINSSILPKKAMDPIQLSLSLTGIAVRSHRLMVDFLTRRPDLGGLGDPAGIGRAFLDLTAKMIADPMSIAQMQLELWKEHVKLLQRTTEQLAGITNKTDHRPVATDRRFQHPAWTENVLFDYIKQSYLRFRGGNSVGG